MPVRCLIIGIMMLAIFSPCRGLLGEEGPVMVFDAHCDTALRVLDEGADIGKRTKNGAVDLVRLREGGVGVQVFALWVSPKHIPDHAVHRTLQLVDAMDGVFRKYPDRVGLALTVRDARCLMKQGKIAAFLSIEGGEAIEDDVAMLRIFHRLGVRSMTLTWLNNLAWADASGDKPLHGGLTKKGVQMVKEMNRLGMVVDVSHVADSTFADVMKHSTKPVIASHSCCRALCSHHRNLTDDQLRALSANGGVVGINFSPEYLSQAYKDRAEKVRKELEPRIAELDKKHRKNREKLREEKRALFEASMKDMPRVTVEDVVAHIEHAVSVAGVDHVGLGTDFDGVWALPEGLEDCSKLQALARALAHRGFAKRDVSKIMGENFLRVFRKVIGH
jgi:membrane dipeptidase